MAALAGLSLTAANFLLACTTGLGSRDGVDGGDGGIPASTPVDALTIFSFGGTMPDVLSEYASVPFNSTYPDIKVNIEVGTIADMYPKILAGRNNPVISGGMVNDTYDQRGILDNLWASFDRNLMTNADRILPTLNPPGGGLAFTVQGLGIAYNPDKVDKPQSWADLFKPEYKDRIGMPKGNYDTFLMATHMLGGKTEDISRGIAEWAKHKDNIAVWTDSPTQQIELVHKGDIWLSPSFASPVITAMRNGQNVKFTIPEEGGSQNTQILRLINGFSPEVERLTQEYLNYFLTPEFQEALIRIRNVSPAVGGVELPDDLRDIEGFLTAEQAAEQLIRFDWSWLSENLRAVEEEVQIQLKS